MLEALFPKSHRRYAALPLLGSRVEDFTRWLSRHGYRPLTVRRMLFPMGRLDQWLRTCGLHLSLIHI